MKRASVTKTAMAAPWSISSGWGQTTSRPRVARSRASCPVSTQTMGAAGSRVTPFRWSSSRMATAVAATRGGFSMPSARAFKKRAAIGTLGSEVRAGLQIKRQTPTPMGA